MNYPDLAPPDMDWTGRPTDLQWCTDVAMPSFHIHTLRSQHLGFLTSYFNLLALSSLHPAVMPARLVFYSPITISLHLIAILHISVLNNQYKRTTAFNTTSSKFYPLQLFAYTQRTSRSKPCSINQHKTKSYMNLLKLRFPHQTAGKNYLRADRNH